MKSSLRRLSVVPLVAVLFAPIANSAESGTIKIIMNDIIISNFKDFSADQLPYEFLAVGNFVGCTTDGTAWFEMETRNDDFPVAGWHGITRDDQHVYSLPAVCLGQMSDGITIYMTPTQLIGMLPDGRWFIAPNAVLATIRE